MLKLFMFISCLSMSILFSRMNHPLAMGLILLVQTTILAIFTGVLSYNFWFSYILFLVFLGGMLVLFIYVTSLASNEMFSISTKTLLFTLIFMGISLLITLSIDHLYPMMPNFSTLELAPILNLDTLPLFIQKLYNTNSLFITVLLILYLFLTLIAVVTITNINFGPLRTNH